MNLWIKILTGDDHTFAEQNLKCLFNSVLPTSLLNALEREKALKSSLPVAYVLLRWEIMWILWSTGCLQDPKFNNPISLSSGYPHPLLARQQWGQAPLSSPSLSALVSWQPLKGGWGHWALGPGSMLDFPSCRSMSLGCPPSFLCRVVTALHRNQS